MSAQIIILAVAGLGALTAIVVLAFKLIKAKTDAKDQWLAAISAKAAFAHSEARRKALERIITDARESLQTCSAELYSRADAADLAERVNGVLQELHAAHNSNPYKGLSSPETTTH